MDFGHKGDHDAKGNSRFVGREGKGQPTHAKVFVQLHGVQQQIHGPGAAPSGGSPGPAFLDYLFGEHAGGRDGHSFQTPMVASGISCASDHFRHNDRQSVWRCPQGFSGSQAAAAH